MQIITELQSMGYAIVISGGFIDCKYNGNRDNFNNAKAAVLLAELKNQKQEALKYLYKRDGVKIAKNMVTEIEGRALLIGWTPTQLAELQDILTGFMPCRIGYVCLQSIEIQTLHDNGNHRGSLRYYNLMVNQPWLKIKEG